MSDPILFGTIIHAAPTLAFVHSGCEGLNLAFTSNSYPYIVMHCGDPALASDLAAAINAVLARHRDLAAEEAA